MTVDWCITGTEEDRLAVETEAVTTRRTLWIEGTDAEDGAVRLTEEGPLSLTFAITPTTIERTREEEIDARLVGLVGDVVTIRTVLNRDKTGRIVGEPGAYRVCSTSRFRVPSIRCTRRSRSETK